MWYEWVCDGSRNEHDPKEDVCVTAGQSPFPNRAPERDASGVLDTDCLCCGTRAENSTCGMAFSIGPSAQVLSL